VELGNLIFGHSRGNFEIPRKEAWESPMFDLQEKLMEGCSPYGTPFENDVFSMRLYDWDAQCTCGYEAIEDKWTNKNKHTKECRLVKPNFLYKPTGFSLMWYKYALRDSFSNRKISLKKWQRMLKHCEESVVQ